MYAVTLQYHDIVRPRAYESSGFSDPDHNRFKLLRTDFAEHLSALAAIPGLRPVTAGDLELAQRNDPPLLLSFDDGGQSAFSEIAPRMERLAWRVHFFIPTATIGKPKFLKEDQIRELADRGHVIGSHSNTHPTRMSALSDDELQEEWRVSIDHLSEILGRAVDVASLPGGHCTPRIAQSAMDAGIRTLFVSDPVIRVRDLRGCRLIGRFRIPRGMSASAVAHLVQCHRFPRLGLWLRWKGKRFAESIGGKQYLNARRWILDH